MNSASLTVGSPLYEQVLRLTWIGRFDSSYYLLWRKVVQCILKLRVLVKHD